MASIRRILPLSILNIPASSHVHADVGPAVMVRRLNVRVLPAG